MTIAVEWGALLDLGTRGGLRRGACPDCFITVSPVHRPRSGSVKLIFMLETPWTRSVLRATLRVMRRLVRPSPSALSISVTAVSGKIDHLVHSDVICHIPLLGYAQARCGERFLPASLTAPPGRRCPGCRRAARPTPTEARRRSWLQLLGRVWSRWNGPRTGRHRLSAKPFAPEVTFVHGPIAARALEVGDNLDSRPRHGHQACSLIRVRATCGVRRCWPAPR